MAEDLDFEQASTAADYTSDDIKTLDWKEHIRKRPGMYIGKLGDGSHSDDGIYVILKEVIDNSIDEFAMGFGKQIVVNITDDGTVEVRDYGRGIPLESVVDVSSKMNTGAKYDSDAFKKSVGLNGVGMKATNALSTYFEISSCRNGEKKKVCYSRGEITDDCPICPTNEENGTYVKFVPDKDIFLNYKYNDEFVETMMKNYSFLNTGLTIVYNGRRIHSRNGLVDLLRENMTNDPLYPIMHFTGTDIEVVITHANQYGEEYYSFVNGQHTTQGGTHLSAFREAVSRTIKEFYGKNFEYSDIRNGMVAAISIKVQEPVFESQTKTKLGSRDMSPDGSLTVAKFIGDFIKRELDNYLHIESQTAEIMLHKIQESEKERKAIAGVTKQTRERAKKEALAAAKRREQEKAAAKRKESKKTTQTAKMAKPDPRRTTVAPTTGNFGKLRGKLTMPTKGTIVAKFGQKREGAASTLAWRGLLIRAKQGQDVVAAGPGTVVFSDWMRGFGNLLIVDHGSNYLSVYANNETLYKSVGDAVKQGETIASVGSSGGEDAPGLYFELRYKGKPFDPSRWIAKN